MTTKTKNTTNSDSKSRLYLFRNVNVGVVGVIPVLLISAIDSDTAMLNILACIKKEYGLDDTLHADIIHNITKSIETAYIEVASNENSVFVITNNQTMRIVN